MLTWQLTEIKVEVFKLIQLQLNIIKLKKNVKTNKNHKQKY